MSAGVMPGVAPQPFGDDAHLGQAGEVVAVVRGHHLRVERRALRRGRDHRGRFGRSRARSADVTTSATPPSLSWQQSSIRSTGSTIHREA